MEEKVVKTWLDIAPAYMDFFLKFVRNPRAAFEKVSGSSKVSSDLTSILLGGVAFSYLLIVFGAPAELKADPSRFAKWLRGLDYRLLPVAAVLAAFAVALVTHWLGKLFTVISGLWESGNRTARLGGTVEDSVNAALGFAAVYIPLCTLYLCGLASLPVELAPVGLAGSILLGLFAWVYFPWSLSATHPETGFWQAFFAFLGAGMLLYVAVLVLSG